MVVKPGIHIERSYDDTDFCELRVRVSDGASIFTNTVYVGFPELDNAIALLAAFQENLEGSPCDLQLGGFGPRHANGAFHARFRSTFPGRLFVSCEQESGFTEFASEHVASRATLYIRSEPALLDRFIDELRALSVDTSDQAFLEAV